MWEITKRSKDGREERRRGGREGEERVYKPQIPCHSFISPIVLRISHLLFLKAGGWVEYARSIQKHNSNNVETRSPAILRASY